jgi:hypothetical protein
MATRIHLAKPPRSGHDRVTNQITHRVTNTIAKTPKASHCGGAIKPNNNKPAVTSGSTHRGMA